MYVSNFTTGEAIGFLEIAPTKEFTGERRASSRQFSYDKAD